ncbi:AAA family ATPase [Streptomyces sp. NPDC091289]|uniref:AAA family ATPase n=1 Tax=Streptomyces sp. NPDC091289 TaxID=3365989 RepID=UPI00381722A3
MTAVDPGPCVVLITGVMAAGKSTVAQLLAESLPRAVHVRGDVFRRMIVSGRAEMTPDEAEEARSQLDLRQRISAQVADAYARDGWTAVVQDIVLGEDLPRYVGRVRTRPLHVIVLAPSPETVREREEARGKTGYGEWTVEAFDAYLRSGTPRIGRWLDTSGQTPEETVSVILDGLRGAGGEASQAAS